MTNAMITTPSAPPEFSSPTEARPRTPKRLRVTALVATVGTVVAMVGLVLLLRPVTTPVQDCGLTVAFILEGRVDVYADPTNPPSGLTTAEVESANAQPCRTRVADAARPGFSLLAIGTVAAVGALILEVAMRVGGWSRRRL